MNLSRRHFLKSMAAVPVIPGILEAAYAAELSDRHLIILWMDGGMSHIDTLDPKPEAGSDIRGPLDTIPTGLDGIRLSAPLKDLAGVIDRCCLVRSINSPEGNHDRGSHYMLTGRRPSQLLTYPSLGSTLSLSAKRRDGIPPYVAIPEAHAYARNGFLPDRFGPFETGGDPGRPDFAVRDLTPGSGVGQTNELIDTLKSMQGGLKSSDEKERDYFLRQAGLMSLNPDMRHHFNLKSEPQSMHQAYGRHKMGQSCLLARRLVQAGVRVVLVRDTGWDHHVNIGQALTYGFPAKLTALNQALTNLIVDLERTGLSEKTTVMLASEFGRTPRLNPSGGRDHWSRASSSLLFGGGIRPGQVIGQTDRRGEEPVLQPVSPADLFATLLVSMGMDRDFRLTSSDGRPIPVVDPEAHIIHDMLA